MNLIVLVGNTSNCSNLLTEAKFLAISTMLYDNLQIDIKKVYGNFMVYRSMITFQISLVYVSLQMAISIMVYGLRFWNRVSGQSTAQE